ncbi:MAG: hypothetical protein ACXIUL_10230 [Wenzhouxiangella sp.]
MKPIGIFIFFFLSTFIHLVVFLLMLILANVVLLPRENPAMLYRYLATAAVFSGYLAVLFTVSFRRSHPPSPGLVEHRGSHWLLRRDRAGKLRVKPLSACFLAAAVFSGLMLTAVALVAVNFVYGLTMPIAISNPFLLMTFGIVAIMVGLFAPVVYKLELDFGAKESATD